MERLFKVRRRLQALLRQVLEEFEQRKPAVRNESLRILMESNAYLKANFANTFSSKYGKGALWDDCFLLQLGKAKDFCTWAKWLVMNNNQLYISRHILQITRPSDLRPCTQNLWAIISLGMLEVDTTRPIGEQIHTTTAGPQQTRQLPGMITVQAEQNGGKRQSVAGQQKAGKGSTDAPNKTKQQPNGNKDTTNNKDKQPLLAHEQPKANPQDQNQQAEQQNTQPIGTASEQAAMTQVLLELEKLHMLQLPLNVIILHHSTPAPKTFLDSLPIS